MEDRTQEPKAEGAEQVQLTFAEALTHLLNNVRMSAGFLPDNFFIQLQVPDAGSMNTEPYLKLVVVDEETGKVKSCEPWEPGRRSIFAKDWHTSKYQGVDVL